MTEKQIRGFLRVKYEAPVYLEINNVFTIGYLDSEGFHVLGAGESWIEAFEWADARGCFTDALDGFQFR